MKTELERHASDGLRAVVERDRSDEIERLRAAFRTLDRMIFDAPQTIEAAGEFRAFIWRTLERKASDGD